MSSSSSSSSVDAEPPWVELPLELTSAILSKLGTVEKLTTAQKVCKTWRRIDIRQSTDDLEIKLDMEKMYRQAVDLSQGQLTHISIHHFRSDHLLLYIARRSNQLRSLEIATVHCGHLIEAVKFLPLLEELHLWNTFVSKEDIKNIGCSCPLLTSFKLNNPWAYDEEALAIAQNIGSRITNEGLEAILDGCPCLESLDLRMCGDVCIAGDLERLFSQ